MEEQKQKLRLFVGVRISVAAAEAIAKSAEALRHAARQRGLKARWVAPENYHITLKFLGWSHAPMVGVLDDAIAEALEGAAAFELETRGLGAFPSPAKARVLWAGASDPEGTLTDLAGRVEAAAQKLGYEAEARAFHPHVTIARLKRPADVTDLLEEASEQEFRGTWVDSVVLFESEVKSTGSEYVPRAIWSLDRPGSGLGRQT